MYDFNPVPNEGDISIAYCKHKILSIYQAITEDAADMADRFDGRPYDRCVMKFPSHVKIETAEQKVPFAQNLLFLAICI